MADTVIVTPTINTVEVVSENAIDVYATGAVSVGWGEGTGTGLSTGTKIYIGPSSGTPLSPQTNDIWIQTT
jgi:hypothetical protein